MIANLFRKMLLPIVGAVFFCSCVNEHEMPGLKDTGSTVTFSMRIPGIATQTRALTADQEYDVATLDVLVFDNAADGQGLLSRATHVGTPTTSVVDGKRYADFVVKLETKANVSSYDFYLVANASELIGTALYSGGTLREGMTKTQVQEALKLTLNAGTAWDTNTKKTLPMWGQLTGQPITANTTYPRTVLTRMVAKIDLSVALANEDNDFDLSEVWLYNYQKQGYVAPKAGAEYFNGKAVAPSIETGWGIEKTTPIEYTDAIVSNGITNSIYVFEAAEGSPANSDYMNNICLVVGGTFNGVEGFYRLDFANMDAETHTPNYMPILRNHHYRVSITAINGPGFGTKDEAYNSKPVNVATEITRWEDGEFVEGVWNGNNHIKFTATEVNFTQFALPSPQTITITTNCPELTFKDFINYTKGSGDTDWAESPAGTWSNGHFTVVINAGAANSEGVREYTLTVTAKETTSVATDPLRRTIFTVKGLNLDAVITIRQEAHVQYMLSTVPGQNDPVFIDGVKQRVKVSVTSTHDYDIAYTHAMFLDVYDSPYGVNTVGPTNISKTIKDVYIEVDVHNSSEARVGEITFRHNDLNSDAGSQILKILQITPTITAKVVGGTGTYKAEIPKAGGYVDIKVESNMTAWEPVLRYKKGEEAVEDYTEAPLSDRFNPAVGSTNATVRFSVGAMPETETKNRTYYITFKDANGSTASEPVIEITHFNKQPGDGGGGTPPTGGILAPAGILAVDKNGVLNLDGPAREGNYIVYFRWGSAIAVSAGTGKNNDVFRGGHIAWTPEELDYDALKSSIGSKSGTSAWALINYAGHSMNTEKYFSSFPTNTPEELAAGLGDPCKLAVKDGSQPGDFRMPTGNSYEKFLYRSNLSSNPKWNTSYGDYGAGMLDNVNNQYYPAAGYRNVDAGAFVYTGGYGAYWSSITYSSTASYRLDFTSTSVYVVTYAGTRSSGYTVRCVSVNP